MSSSLVVIGRPRRPCISDQIRTIAANLNVAVAFEVHPSVGIVTELLATDGDCCFQVDTPESGTATELEGECAALGRGARLPSLLAALADEQLRSEVRLAWSWDFPDPTMVRHAEGDLTDMVSMLSRPETWGQLEETRLGTYYRSYEGILLFHLARRNQ